MIEFRFVKYLELFKNYRAGPWPYLPPSKRDIMLNDALTQGLINGLETTVREKDFTRYLEQYRRRNKRKVVLSKNDIDSMIVEAHKEKLIK